jgi:hypothetical protein
VTVAVYGITTGRRVPAVAGVRLRMIRVGRLAAIVSPVRRLPSATHANLRRYHRIVAAIAEQVPSMLPARFATVMEETELAFVLRSRANTFAASLAHLGGRVQMTVRVIDPSITARAAAPATRNETGAAYLRRQARRASAGAIPGMAIVAEAVGQWVRDERVEIHDGIASLYHLVPRRSSAAYARRAAGAGRRAGLRVTVSGPFPPYAFSAL